jgi:hypothetical protein
MSRAIPLTSALLAQFTPDQIRGTLVRLDTLLGFYYIVY